MLSERSPVTFQDPLPASVDVVVIGGGVIGISTAWFLRKRGSSVLVCEKGRVAGEQSSRNWGWIRQQGRDAAEVPIAMDSVNRVGTIVEGDRRRHRLHAVRRPYTRANSNASSPISSAGSDRRSGISSTRGMLSGSRSRCVVR